MTKYPQYVVESPEKQQGKWQERSGNNHPIHIEIGSGRDYFIYKMTKAHPEVNYIGVDMRLNILPIALDKLVVRPLPSLQLLRVDSGALAEYFTGNKVDLIYLNSSDPWPKKRHEKCRLTYKNFLAADEIILKPNRRIHFKTDSRGFFEYSLSNFSRYDMIIECIWLDLRNSEFEGSIMTGYEERFSNHGQRVYRVETRFVAK